ncbi:hypothetical protein TWF506_008935 [Arthrobotrys conoides]|uniref:F-box domain-containing protein n=1 Tax=Arthrobotrys conoides TaxID=74498 RepID=A0AAN8NMR4_9PEZI
MATLSLLPVELIYHVTSYLDECEVVYFLRTSKHFYSILRRRVWSTFTIHEHWQDASNYLAKLADLTREVGTDALGYRYIKKIEILTPGNSFGRGQSMKSGFHDILLDLIDTGKIELREIYVRANGIYGWPRRIYDDAEHHSGGCIPQRFFFLRRIREYAQSKSIQEFSMGIATDNILSLIEADVLEVSLLTKLSVTMSLGGEAAWNENEDETGRRRYLTMLPGVLTQAAGLRELGFRVEPGIRSTYRPGSVHQKQFSESLNNFQTAVSSLKRLRVLKIGNDGNRVKPQDQVLFHPSFFLYPPENCKVLEYSATVSVAWWRQFASHPFAGVEHLKLNIIPMERLGPVQWIDDRDWEYSGFIDRTLGLDEEITKGPVNEWDFRLYSVAMRGLKKLTLDLANPGSERYPQLRGYPRDLVDCIKRENNCSILEV